MTHTGLVVDPTGGVRTVQVPGSPDKAVDFIHEAIGCECFTVTVRSIEGECFDVYCDDEALLHDPVPLPAWYDRYGYICGPILILRRGEGGDSASLSDRDIELIRASTRTAAWSTPDGCSVLGTAVVVP